MLALLRSGTVLGIEAVPVSVEVDIAFGLPGFSLVGLPDSAVKESRERVFSALKNSGFSVPSRRITINLAPADLRKEGTAFDLPMAIGILAASEQIDPESWEDVLVLGELALDGGLRPVRGLLSMVLMAREQGWERVILPAANAQEAALVPGIRPLPVATLHQAIQVMKTGVATFVISKDPVPVVEGDDFLNFSEIKGQAQAKRALEVAAAGGHNFLMVGSPGCGKTLMARRLPSILPPLSEEEGLETTRVYSVAGLMKPGHGLMRQRPFRSPHHSISDQALVGGGKIPRPGEVSLAHLGVLFLDELPEFRKSTLETLRQPLEDGCVTIARTAHTVTYPSRCMLGAAMNPCGRVALLPYVQISLKTQKTLLPKELDFELRHIGDHIRRCRIIHGLTQNEVARLVGVKNSPTISNWERGVYEPHIEELPAVFQFLGYDPYPTDTRTLSGRMMAKRRAMGWTVQKAARQFGTDKRTWWAWEREVNAPFTRNMNRLEKFLAYYPSKDGSAIQIAFFTSP